MAKSFSPSEMLGRSRARQSQADQPPSDEAATSEPVDESTSTPVDSLIAAITNVSAGGSPAATRYQKTAVFFAPHQRDWLRTVSRELPEGLSTSDVVRLAVERLMAEVESGGLGLQPALVAQARQEAGRYAGRRNSGVKQLAGD